MAAYYYREMSSIIFADVHGYVNVESMIWFPAVGLIHTRCC